MKLIIGLVMLLLGAILAVIGYAPRLSSLAGSVPLISVAGLMISAGIFMVLYASARAIDTSDLDNDSIIRP